MKSVGWAVFAAFFLGASVGAYVALVMDWSRTEVANKVSPTILSTEMAAGERGMLSNARVQTEEKIAFVERVETLEGLQKTTIDELGRLRQIVTKLEASLNSTVASVTGFRQEASEALLNQANSLEASPDSALVYQDLDYMLDGVLDGNTSPPAAPGELKRKMAVLNAEQRMQIRIKVTNAINEGRVDSNFYYKLF